MNWAPIIAGLITAIAVIAAVVVTRIDCWLKHRNARIVDERTAHAARTKGGLSLILDDPTDEIHDCDGCDDCGAPMAFDECPMLPPIEDDPVAIRLRLVDDPGDVKLTALGYVRYADRTVHRVCLAARRDGREPCHFCAPVLAGAS